MRGFTLVELLAAVAIVGVLATLAMPRYRAQVARGRQAEAKTNLGTIHKLQKAYFSEDNRDEYHSGLHYGIDKCGETLAEGINGLGFRLTDCTKSRYRYITNAGNDCAKSDGNLNQGKIYPGCSANDEWHISDTGKLTNPQNVIKQCPGGANQAQSGCNTVALAQPPIIPSPVVNTPPSQCCNSSDTLINDDPNDPNDCSYAPTTDPVTGNSVCTVTTPPACDTAAQCCDGNNVRTSCPTGQTLEAFPTCCTTTPPPPPPACNAATQCCDGSNVRTSCPTGQTLEAFPDCCTTTPPPPVVNPPCNATCEEGCTDWSSTNDWSGWNPTQPAIAISPPILCLNAFRFKQTRNKVSRRTCENLCSGVTCADTEIETQHRYWDGITNCAREPSYLLWRRIDEPSNYYCNRQHVKHNGMGHIVTDTSKPSISVNTLEDLKTATFTKEYKLDACGQAENDIPVNKCYCRSTKYTRGGGMTKDWQSVMNHQWFPDLKDYARYDPYQSKWWKREARPGCQIHRWADGSQCATQIIEYRSVDGSKNSSATQAVRNKRKTDCLAKADGADNKWSWSDEYGGACIQTFDPN